MVIKTLKISENPLADFGNIVEGNRFVGREKEITEIHNRVTGTAFGNIAIMGLPRCGKSSLVWNALMESRDELIKTKIVVIRINVGGISSSQEFFDTLIDESFFEIGNLIDEQISHKIEKILNLLQSEKLKIHEQKRYLHRFYKLLKKTEFRIIYIFDEFDYVTKFFKLEDFQLLRELSISPETKIALVTISRHSIQEIELENGTISTLAGVFHNLNLSMFSDDDLKKYWQRFESFGIETDEEYRNKIEEFAGSHPHLLDLLNYKIINRILEGKNELINIFISVTSSLKLDLYNHYDKIIKLIEDEKLLNKLFQVIYGPVYNLKQSDIERLLKFGLIKKQKESNEYHSFANYFSGYLELRQKDFDFWPLWNETENQLRKLIKHYLIIKYSQQWKDSFVKKNPKKEKEIKKYEYTKLKNIKNYGTRASDDLIDYTNYLELFDCFITTDWPWFKKIFQEQIKDWRKRFFILGKVRNPLAHNNSNFINEDDYNQAIGICNLIQQRIRESEKI